MAAAYRGAMFGIERWTGMRKFALFFSLFLSFLFIYDNMGNGESLNQTPQIEILKNWEGAFCAALEAAGREDYYNNDYYGEEDCAVRGSATADVAITPGLFRLGKVCLRTCVFLQCLGRVLLTLSVLLLMSYVAVCGRFCLLCRILPTATRWRISAQSMTNLSTRISSTRLLEYRALEAEHR